MFFLIIYVPISIRLRRISPIAQARYRQAQFHGLLKNAVRFAIHLHQLYHQNLVFVKMRQKRRGVGVFFVT